MQEVEWNQWRRGALVQSTDETLAARRVSGWGRMASRAVVETDLPGQIHDRCLSDHWRRIVRRRRALRHSVGRATTQAMARPTPQAIARRAREPRPSPSRSARQESPWDTSSFSKSLSLLLVRRLVRQGRATRASRALGLGKAVSRMRGAIGAAQTRCFSRTPTPSPISGSIGETGWPGATASSERQGLHREACKVSAIWPANWSIAAVRAMASAASVLAVDVSMNVACSLFG